MKKESQTNLFITQLEITGDLVESEVHNNLLVAHEKIKSLVRLLKNGFEVGFKCDNYDPEIAFPTGNGKCKNCGKWHEVNEPETSTKNIDILEDLSEILDSEFKHTIDETNSEIVYKKYEQMRIRILEKIKKKLLPETSATVPIIQIHAVRNFFFANHNLRKDTLIEKVFEGKDEHWISFCKELFAVKCNFDLYKLIEYINESEAAILITWIMKNYNAFPIETVERLSKSE